MTILQLIQKPQLRGAEIFACQLSQHLKAMGHKVIVVSLFPGNDGLPFDGTFICMNRPVSSRKFDYQGWKRLNEIIREYQPDVVQCNAGDTLKYAVFSKFFFGWKTPVIARNASMVGLYIKNPVGKILNGFLYRKTNYVISVSQNSKDDLVKLFPFVKNKINVIPVGIELKEPKSIDWKNGDLASINLVHVGGFTFEKNHEGLLSIFQHFLKTKPQSHLHLLGKGPLQDKIKTLVAEKNLQEKVTFYDWVKNPMDYIAKADVLLLPSIIEGLPGVVLEAMWCKTSVVAYNVGGVKEVLQPKKTGYLVEKNQESDFVAQLVSAIENPQQFVDAAYDNVCQNYSNLALAKQFVMVYDNFKSMR